ncbi:MAG TPA: single-stranded DNA-binding protein [Candidatus Cloacimonadota bacterium]|jgi:single-strand DNA-binding protein|nr:single-stranded DNA-binding protein [Candidatus Cloacimonadota bacterium]HOF59860.1 single-stranded DNA-binding protein [Candidatus Cloacimonadota bacterium]HQL13951.1 single-stranded DNA-binding protein [Candidatus Cloacimonadota bacterium]HQO44583.1 single-stranded DNA-binding protein [Candidatus Cloacimonadota bacterium]HQP18416.1 single-stranded DNA-binding protein [Candidatus Cloacimonadota bacterium]
MADLKLPRINKAMIAGRITQDLELRVTPKGTSTVRFAVAVDRSYKDDSDQWQQVTSYIDVVVWGDKAENICKHAQKGTAVYVEGRIDTRSYTDQNNINRKIFEIVADNVQTLEWKPRDGETTEPTDMPSQDESSKPSSQTNTKDDLPF